VIEYIRIDRDKQIIIVGRNRFVGHLRASTDHLVRISSFLQLPFPDSCIVYERNLLSFVSVLFGAEKRFGLRPDVVSFSSEAVACFLVFAISLIETSGRSNEHTFSRSLRHQIRCAIELKMPEEYVQYLKIKTIEFEQGYYGFPVSNRTYW